MTTDTKRLRLGRLLLIGLVFLASCRNDQPPSIEVCILDGHGGGDCVEADGSKKYRLPSEMLNYWSTGQSDMKNFSSWCYQTSKSNVKTQMDLIFQEAKAPYSDLALEN